MNYKISNFIIAKAELIISLALAYLLLISFVFLTPYFSTKHFFNAMFLLWMIILIFPIYHINFDKKENFDQVKYKNFKIICIIFMLINIPLTLSAYSTSKKKIEDNPHLIYTTSGTIQNLQIPSSRNIDHVTQIIRTGQNPIRIRCWKESELCEYADDTKISITYENYKNSQDALVHTAIINNQTTDFKSKYQTYIRSSFWFSLLFIIPSQITFWLLYYCYANKPFFSYK